jgi:hypothetical protein
MNPINWLMRILDNTSAALASANDAPTMSNVGWTPIRWQNEIAFLGHRHYIGRIEEMKCVQQTADGAGVLLDRELKEVSQLGGR